MTSLRLPCRPAPPQGLCHLKLRPCCGLTCASFIPYNFPVTEKEGTGLVLCTTLSLPLDFSLLPSFCDSPPRCSICGHGWIRESLIATWTGDSWGCWGREKCPYHTPMGLLAQPAAQTHEASRGHARTETAIRAASGCPPQSHPEAVGERRRAVLEQVWGLPWLRSLGPCQCQCLL